MASAPDDDHDEGSEDSAHSSLMGGERSLMKWFAIVLGVNVLSLLWLSVRADSPIFVRNILDFFLYGTIGAMTAYFAFRALFLFPFRMQDLFVIVMLLSLELKIAVDEMNRLSNLGLVGYGIDDPRHLGQIFQVSLLTASVAVGGAAIGLRHCHLLKIESALWRTMTLVSGILALPAAAGIAGFLVLAVFSFSGNQMNESLIFLLLWFLSLLITGLNVAYFIKTVTLNTEIGSKEKLS